MKISISKLDAAKRQLESSLRIFFNDGDPVSIHTLVNASDEILSKLCSKHGVKSIIDEGIEKFVRVEKRKELREKLTEAKNFFKHSGFNENKSVEFNHEVNPILLWDSCRLYQILTSEFTPIMTIFNIWFSLKNKDLILDEKKKEILESLNYTEYLDIENKKHFLETMLPLAQKI